MLAPNAVTNQVKQVARNACQIGFRFVNHSMITANLQSVHIIRFVGSGSRNSSHFSNLHFLARSINLKVFT